MGWLVMWCTVFMLMASAMVNHSVERRDAAEIDGASVVAAQMVAWHKAAVAVCNDPVLKDLYCLVSGKVDPAQVRAKLGFLRLKLKDPTGAVPLMGSTVFANAPAYDSGHFVALVNTDPAEQVVVTYYRNPQAGAQLEGRIVSELTAGQGWSAMMGFYDRANNRVDRVAVLADDNPLKLAATLPPAFGSESIPDNAPVVVTRY